MTHTRRLSIGHYLEHWCPLPSPNIGRGRRSGLNLRWPSHFEPRKISTFRQVFQNNMTEIVDISDQNGAASREKSLLVSCPILSSRFTTCWWKSIEIYNQDSFAFHLLVLSHIHIPKVTSIHHETKFLECSQCSFVRPKNNQKSY